MKTHEALATTLHELLRGDRAVRITVDGYMPLVIEDIGRSLEGGLLIALAHTGLQNGDVMHDPEIVFEVRDIDGSLFAEPLSFRNDYVGAYSEVYVLDAEGRRSHVRPAVKSELMSFARTWFRNLREQGFLGERARREVLS